MDHSSGWDFCGEQLPPSLIWIRSCTRRVVCRVAVGRFGRRSRSRRWPQVGRRSQGWIWEAARHTCTSATSSAGRSVLHLSGAGRRISCGVAADLVGELQQPGLIERPAILAPMSRVGGDPVGNAGQPQPRTVSTAEHAGVFKAPVQHGSSVLGAAGLSGIARGLRCRCCRIDAVHGEEEAEWARRVGHAGSSGQEPGDQLVGEACRCMRRTRIDDLLGGHVQGVEVALDGHAELDGSILPSRSIVLADCGVSSRAGSVRAVRWRWWAYRGRIALCGWPVAVAD